MFEKSLYDLIRGMRNHKGNEREYIQSSIRECRKEIKSNDMDLKATALLKLTYLEMFGHDMSWASFNVLEVMSSPKYLQKRVGYLAAIQSFRPDTEVLMLAENLLKKDLLSPHPTTITLPLLAIPHVINPSMANSLLSDLLPRLSHSSPAIRKKTIVALYRLALVYPETLRPSWPKITERLQDESEDASVTAAVVNVVCELGWRRPRDFLPLAPRLFDLLVNQGNNWVAIKIIKLFATLTPLEPRLVKKLLPPLTTIIKSTLAMSLLYECINGIIQGGVLSSIEGTSEGEEVAILCISKLRGMLAVESDPNLKFVALLAFRKIVDSHAHLVSLHQDAILDCLDDPDISIRARALDLAVGMVDADNLMDVVMRLLSQLEKSPILSNADNLTNDRAAYSGVEPHADSDDEDAEETIRPGTELRDGGHSSLPEEYRINVMRQILLLCSKNTYANITDFEWYINVLVKLIRVCPPIRRTEAVDADALGSMVGSSAQDISYDIGNELLSVAVRVKSLRPHATFAAQTLLLLDQRNERFPEVGNGGQGVLGSAAWIAGEFASLLPNAEGVLSSLLDSSSSLLPPDVLAIYIQAIPKILVAICGSSSVRWTPQRRTMVVLLLARVVHFLEPLATHPVLEVQERVVELLELFKLVAEASSSQDVGTVEDDFVEPPLLLTQALPSLFEGQELNPVAPGAQRKVPLPEGVDLDRAINEDLEGILQTVHNTGGLAAIDQDIDIFYNHRPTVGEKLSAAEMLDRAQADLAATSYQQSSAADYLDATLATQRKAERLERNRDDPFYIGDRARSPAFKSGASSPLGRIIRGNNESFDIDSIPIMKLDLSGNDHSNNDGVAKARTAHKKPGRRHDVLQDETLAGEIGSSRQNLRQSSRPASDRHNSDNANAKGLLQVDSSGLQNFSLDDSSSKEGPRDYEARQEELQMLKQVEKLQLEMQRASERVKVRDNSGHEDGIVVKKKKKRVGRAPLDGAGHAEAGLEGSAVGGDAVVKVKKTKLVKKSTRRKAAMEEPVLADAAPSTP